MLWEAPALKDLALVEARMDAAKMGSEAVRGWPGLGPVLVSKAAAPPAVPSSPGSNLALEPGGDGFTA